MSSKGSNKRRALNSTTIIPNGKTPTVPPASRRVLSIPELLSLIFGFLAHTDIAHSEGGEEDTEISSFSKPSCSCLCRQCVSEDDVLEKNATGVISLPSPFAIPLAKQTRRKNARGHPGRKRGSRYEVDGDKPNGATCHCRTSTHGQLSTLFGKTPAARRASGPNKPSYNLTNSLVCKRWSPIALDVLWRVVDQPERLFSLLDGSWGSKLKSTAPGSSERLKALRGLQMAEWGDGRMPVWWEPGVQAFLDIREDESDDESDFDGSEGDPTPPNRVRKREFELFSFRSAPTPASWARFDRYARRVRHLVYIRPCLSESALNQIGVTRPRLVVLPRMHTLSWADNPLQHAVLFMHAGVTRLELRIELFGQEKTDRHASVEQTMNTYKDLGLNDFSFSGGPDGTEKMGYLFGLGNLKEEVKPNRSITRTLATQLAEIPRRMPNIQTLCVSSFIPLSLYLPALLCTLFKPPSAPTADQETPSPPTPTLSKLKRVVLPRYYTNAAVIEQLSLLPQLEVIEYQFDDALGWGRPNDVGLGRCVPKAWKLYEPEEHPVGDDDDRETTPRRGWFGSLVGGRNDDDDDVHGEVQATSESEEEELEHTPQPTPTAIPASPLHAASVLRVSSSTFPKLCDLSLTIPLTDARDLLLSSPPTEVSSDAPNAPLIIPSISLTERGLPGWPQNLVTLYLDAPPGFLAAPTEIKSLIHAIALACYGPSTSYDGKPARLERLSIVCCADMDSGYYALNDALDEGVPGIGEVKSLSRKTIDPLLDLLPGKHGTTQPRFPLKLFEILHHYPMVLTQEDVELVAERWGGCIEKLVLNCEPVAAFGISGPGVFDGDGGLDNQAHRPGATLTLAALLPFARYCTELRHLGLFVDASKGVQGLMQPIFGHSSKQNKAAFSKDMTSQDKSLDPIDTFTSTIAARYLKYPLSHPSIPNAYPVFQKLERLSLGISVLPVSLDDVEVQFASPKRAEDAASSVGDADDDEGESNVGQAGSTVSFDDDDEPAGGADKEELIGALRDAAQARLSCKGAIVDEKSSGQGEGGVAHSSEDSAVMSYLRRSGVRLGLIEEDELELEVKTATPSTSRIRSQDPSNLVPLFLAQILPCFPSPNHGAPPNSASGSSALTTVIDAGTTLSACPTSLMASSWAIEKYWTIGEPLEFEDEVQRKRRRRRQREQQEQQDVGTTGSGATAASSAPPSPTPDDMGVPPNASSTLVVPFLPPLPSFSPPSGYLPRIFSAVFRARVEKWLEMNETVLPTAVAMREGGWVWGGRVANELGKTQSEVDELQVRVEVMDGLTQARARIGKGKEDNQLDNGPDRCIVC